MSSLTLAGEHAAEYFASFTSTLDEAAAAAFAANMGCVDSILEQASALAAALLVADHSAGSSGAKNCSRLCHFPQQLLSKLQRSVSVLTLFRT